MPIDRKFTQYMLLSPFLIGATEDTEGKEEIRMTKLE